MHQPTTFAHKNLQLEGITVFWDEFSELSRAGCKSSHTPTVGRTKSLFLIIQWKEHMHNTHLILILQETEPKLSPSWNPKIICEPHPQFTEPVYSSAPFEPVQVGDLGGKIEISLTLKNNLAMPGAKVCEFPPVQHSSLSGVSMMNYWLFKNVGIICVIGRMTFFRTTPVV